MGKGSLGFCLGWVRVRDWGLGFGVWDLECWGLREAMGRGRRTTEVGIGFCRPLRRRRRKGTGDGPVNFLDMVADFGFLICVLSGFSGFFFNFGFLGEKARAVVHPQLYLPLSTSPLLVPEARVFPTTTSQTPNRKRAALHPIILQPPGNLRWPSATLGYDTAVVASSRIARSIFACSARTTGAPGINRSATAILFRATGRYRGSFDSRAQSASR